MKKLVKKPVLSVIIVYYGEFSKTQELIGSINRSSLHSGIEIIIVNNKVGDKKVHDLAGTFKNVSVIESGANLGYARGNNIGVEHSGGKYVFIVNSDTKIIKGSLELLIAELETNKTIGIIAPNLADNTGNLFQKQGTQILTPVSAIFSLTILSKIFPNNRFYRKYYLLDADKNTDRTVGVVPGTAFMISRKLFDRLGGFDPNFFLYFEETDICKRVSEMGLKCVMTADTVLMHDWQEDSKSTQLKKYFMESRFYYFKKHYGSLWAFTIELFARINKWHLIIALILVSVTVTLMGLKLI